MRIIVVWLIRLKKKNKENVIVLVGELLEDVVL